MRRRVMGCGRRACERSSGNDGTDGGVAHGREEDDAALGALRGCLFPGRGGGGEEHAAGFLAADGACGEVGDDDDELSDEFVRRVVLADAGADLSCLARAVVELELEEAIGVRVRLGVRDARDAEIEPREVIEGDLGLWVWHGYTSEARRERGLSVA